VAGLFIVTGDALHYMGLRYVDVVQ